MALAMTEPSPAASLANKDTLWDANDVAAFLKVSRSWVYHRAKCRQVPHVRACVIPFESASVLTYARGGSLRSAKRLPLGALRLARSESPTVERRRSTGR
jgi:hypothetical protein